MNFLAGLDIGLLLGTGPYMRDALDIGSVGNCSCAYGAGNWASMAGGAGRMTYAGISKAGSVLASSGAAASAFRSELKSCMSGGLTKNIRKPDLRKYATDDALRAAAGRTSTSVNAYGAGVTSAGAIGGDLAAAINDAAMKTFPVASGPDGRLRAFEVENAYIGPFAVAKVLRLAEGVTEVRQRRLFSRESEVHVKFKHRGHSCIVWEPYCDNSRYWIGPDNTEYFAEDMTVVERVFASYRPPLHRALVGNILTF